MSHSRSTGKFMIPVSALKVGVETLILMGPLMETRFNQSAVGTEEGKHQTWKNVDVMEKYNSRQKYYAVTHVCYVGTALDVPRGCLFSCELKSHSIYEFQDTGYVMFLEYS